MPTEVNVSTGTPAALSVVSAAASELRSRPPILLVHGTEDPVVSYSSMAAAETALKAAGVPVETVTSVGIGHSIDEQGLRRGGQFLKNVLSGTTPRGTTP